MGILNNLGLGRGLGMFKRAGVSAGLKSFRDVLKVADFMTANVELVSGKWNDLGSYTVGAQQQVNVGYGGDDKPENAGFLYIKLIDTATGTIKGKFRILMRDANEVGKATLFNEDLDRLSGDKNDRAKMIMLPEDTSVSASEDEKISLQVYPDDTTTLDYASANTYIAIPVTVRYMKAK